MKKFFIITVLLFMFLSCKKDPRGLIEGIWSIQSITFNGIEKKDDPLLHGITKYDINYDESFCEWCEKYGGMKAEKSDNSIFVSFPFRLTADNDTFTVLCSYNPAWNQSGSYLPYMIDTSLSFCGSESWKVVQLDDHKFISQLVYKGNTYLLNLTK